MDVSAIILLTSPDGASFAGHHLATIDVLGRSALLRVIRDLERLKISRIALISERRDLLPPLPAVVNVITFDQDRVPSDRIVSSVTRDSKNDLVLAIRVGPYAEIDYYNLIEFHRQQDRSVSAVFDADTEAPIALAINASRRNELAYLLRHKLSTARHPYAIYPFVGYFNPLGTVADLRRLAIDAFCGNAKLQPIGVEQRPGVWIAQGAGVHPRARIVAPAFIGAHSRVRDCAVITRCSVLEHHVQVGAGAVVENATLLPETTVGPRLDISHAVVGFARFVHLGRNVEVQITDPRLVGQISAAPVRFVEHLASLATFLPSQFLRGLAFSSKRDGRVPPIPQVGQQPYPALAPAEQEFPAPLAGVRRYGDD